MAETEYDDTDTGDDSLDYGGGTPLDASGGPGSLFSLMAMQSSTTPEARKRAEDVLTRYEKGLDFADEDKILERLRSSADESRAALRAARERLLSRPYYNPAQTWLSLGAALGAPTKTGGFGESTANAAGALSQAVGAQETARRAQSEDQLKLEEALANVDQNTLAQQLRLAEMKRRTEAGLAGKAFDVLSRPVLGGRGMAGNPMARSIIEADRAYLRNDYTPFVRDGGAQNGLEAIATLDELEKNLRSGKAKDTITGPMRAQLGNLHDVPVVGKIGKLAQEVFYPEGTSVENILSTVVPKGERMIQGKNYTEEEASRVLDGFRTTMATAKSNKEFADAIHAYSQRLRETYARRAEDANYYDSASTIYKAGSHLPSLPSTTRKVGFGTGNVGGKYEVVLDVPTNATKEQMQALYDDWKSKQPQHKAKGGKIRSIYSPLPNYSDEALRELKYHTEVELNRKRVLKQPISPDLQSELDSYVDELNRRSQPIPEDEQQSPPKPYRRGGKVRKRARGGEVISFEDIPDDKEDQQQPSSPKPEARSVAEMILGASAGAFTGAGAGYSAGDLGARLTDMYNNIKRPNRPEKMLLNAYQRGNEDIGASTSRVQRQRSMGVPSTLADVASPDVSVLGREAMIRGSSSQFEKTAQDLRDRSRQTPGRIENAIDTSINSEPFAGADDKLTQALYANSEPLYRAAYEKYPGISEKDIPAFADIMKTPDGQNAVKIALRLLRNKGMTIGREDAIGMVRKPSLQFLDYVKRGFDQLVAKEEGSGANWQSTALGSSMRDLRNQLRDQLDAVAPEYKTARAQYAGDVEVRDALRTGLSSFGSMRPEELAAQWGNMSDAEKRAFRTGAAQWLRQRIEPASGRDDVNAAHKILDSSSLSQKLAIMAEGNPDILHAALEGEANIFDRSRGLANSIEQGRTAEQMRLRDRAQEFHPMDWAKSKLSRPMKPEEMDQITQILREGDPQKISALAAKYGPMSARWAARKQLRGRMGKAGALLGAGVGAATLPMIDQPGQ